MINDFTDLDVWKLGHKLVISIYLMLKDFPKFEQYGLSDQMRRAAVSITSNIAEGFGRQGAKEKIQFYYMAEGSLTELKNQMFVARDVGYIDTQTFNQIQDQIGNVYRLLRGFIKSTRNIFEHAKP